VAPVLERIHTDPAGSRRYAGGSSGRKALRIVSARQARPPHQLLDRYATYEMLPAQLSPQPHVKQALPLRRTIDGPPFQLDTSSRPQRWSRRTRRAIAPRRLFARTVIAARARQRHDRAGRHPE
jgi:hypothetical protein